MSIQETDAASAAVAKNPDGRVKLADIEAEIDYEFTSSIAALTRDSRYGKPPGVVEVGKSISLHDRAALMTVHVIFMKNGFTIIGTSAPLDPANFNAELGRKFAREDAIRQIWPAMGFARAQAALAP